MRKIKFRGKDENNKWWYGGYYNLPDGKEGVIHRIAVNNCTNEKFEFHDVIINPDTVGQFTGLLDKNGKEIYEGDIVKDINDELQQVRWFWSGWGLQRLSDDEKSGWCVVPGYDKEREFVEIVGNIYDNPELLSK